MTTQKQKIEQLEKKQQAQDDNINKIINELQNTNNIQLEIIGELEKIKTNPATYIDLTPIQKQIKRLQQNTGNNTKSKPTQQPT